MPWARGVPAPTTRGTWPAPDGPARAALSEAPAPGPPPTDPRLLQAVTCSRLGPSGGRRAWGEGGQEGGLSDANRGDPLLFEHF